MKAEGEKIACITGYDASFAALVDEAGADVVLVGDSLGMVIQGHDTTVPVTLEDIIYHCKAVGAGLVSSVPDGRHAVHDVTPRREQALENAVRLMQEGGAKMVKLEGGAGQVEIVEFLASHDIPVCAHLGLQATVSAQDRRLPRAGPRGGRGRADDATMRRRSRRRAPTSCCSNASHAARRRPSRTNCTCR